MNQGGPLLGDDGKTQYNKMIGLVETTMTADSSRPTACRPDKDRIRFVEGYG